MKSLANALCVVLGTACTFGTVLLLAGMLSAHAAVAIPVSGNVGLIPPQRDVVVAPLAASEARVSSDAALATAERSYGLADSEIDRTAGVVRAAVSRQGDAKRQNLKAWMVVADVKISAPWGVGVYHRLVIVVDAVTGQDLFAYTADRTLS